MKLSYWLLPITLGLGSSVLAWQMFSNIGWFQAIELRVNRSTQLSQRPVPRHPDIRLILIDNDTNSQLNVPATIDMVPREFHAELIDALKAAGAKAVLLDIKFETSVPAADAQLQRSIAHSSPMKVVLSERAALEVDKSGELQNNVKSFKPNFVEPTIEADNWMRASVESAVRDEVIIGFRPVQMDHSTLGRTVPHASLAMALCALGFRVKDLRLDLTEMKLHVGSRTWDLDSTGTYLNGWVEEGKDFPSQEYAAALRALRTPQGKAMYRDKLVLVGGDVDRDPQTTPNNGRMGGVAVLAHQVSSLLQPSVSQASELSMAQNLLWGGALCLVAALTIWPLRFGLTVGGSILALTLASFGPQLAFRWSGIWLNTVFPFTGVLITILMVGIVASLRSSGLAKRFTPTHVRENRKSGAIEDATVLFVDLKGSTPTVLEIGIEGSTALLSKLLTVLTAEVRKSGGEVEHMAGDGLMAVFRGSKGGAHANRCLSCVRSIRHEVAEFGQEIIGQDNKIELTVGIESGPISGAVIRSASSEEWSSFGETIHLAARLQAACKEYRVDTLLGPGAHTNLRMDIEMYAMGRAMLRGFESRGPIEIWSLDELSTPDTTNEEQG